MTQTPDQLTSLAGAARTIGDPVSVLTEAEVRRFVRESLDAADLDGRSVCLVIPTAPGAPRCRC